MRYKASTLREGLILLVTSPGPEFMQHDTCLKLSNISRNINRNNTYKSFCLSCVIAPNYM